MATTMATLRDIAASSQIAMAVVLQPPSSLGDAVLESANLVFQGTPDQCALGSHGTLGTPDPSTRGPHDPNHLIRKHFSKLVVENGDGATEWDAKLDES